MNTDFLIEKKLNREAPELNALVKDSVVVLQNTLDYCRRVTAERSDFEITQDTSVIIYL